MAVLQPTGFDSLLLDKVVAIGAAFSSEQAALDHLVSFTTERDRMTAPSDDELVAGPIVSFSVPSIAPAATGSSRDNGLFTYTLQADCYVAKKELSNGGGDKAVRARLMYLKEQLVSMLFSKANTNLGFSTMGVVARKRWGRWIAPTLAEAASEMWICDGQLTVEIDSQFDPTDLTMIDLEEILVTVKKSNNPTGPYSTLWAALYPNLDA